MAEQLVPPLSKTVGKRPAAKEGGGSGGDGGTGTGSGGGGGSGGSAREGGPEAERAFDLVKSGVRAVLAVSAIEEVGQVCRKWQEFVDKVKKDDYTAFVIKSLETDKSFDSY